MISDATINIEPAVIELDLGTRVKTSALGQKQTCAAQKVMSALPPKADMCRALAHVRFVPIADIQEFDPLC